jgi:hypothetical protein
MGSGFEAAQEISNGQARVLDFDVADIDGDGAPDTISLSLTGFFVRKAIWNQNLGNGAFGPDRLIDSLLFGPASIRGADVDGDGDQDILLAISASGPTSEIRWYPNFGAGVFGAKRILVTLPFEINEVTMADLDGDGNPDLLARTINDAAHSIEWYPNLGGGVFGPARTVVANLLFPSAMQAADLDGDGDLDVLTSAVSSGKQVTWSENLGAGLFAPPATISSTPNTPTDVSAADLDGDGDLDVLSASSSDGRIAWYRNLGGGLFGGLQVITNQADGAVSVSAADLDGDGIIDVLSGSENDHIVAWYKNLGNGSFGPQDVIGVMPSATVKVLASDLDGDGEPDVLASSSTYPNGELVWYENKSFLDCNGNAIDDALDIATGTSADCNANGIPDECDLNAPGADIDGDGQLDVCVSPPLMADTYELSVSAGGTQTFALLAPVSYGLNLLLGTLSGTSPGTASGGLVIPLNIEAYLVSTAIAPNMPPLAGSFGVLTPAGSSGQASASFTLLPASSPALAGLTFHHAYITLDAVTGALTSASNAVPVTILP